MCEPRSSLLTENNFRGPPVFHKLAKGVLLTDKEVGSARKAGARDACNLCYQTFLVLCASLTCLDEDMSCRGEPGLIQLHLLDTETKGD